MKPKEINESVPITNDTQNLAEILQMLNSWVYEKDGKNETKGDLDTFKKGVAKNSKDNDGGRFGILIVISIVNTILIIFTCGILCRKK